MPVQTSTPNVAQSRRMAIAAGTALRRHLIETATTRAEQRWARRKQVDIPAIIIFEGGSSIRATIRDTSSSGALLELSPQAAGFDEFKTEFWLSFTCYRTKTDVACRIMRRNGRALGVKFVGSFQTTLQPPPAKPKPKPAKGIARVIEKVRAVRAG